MAEQVLLLENIATSVLVGHDQLPSLYKILTEAAGILQMDVPDLYVRQVSLTPFTLAPLDPGLLVICSCLPALTNEI